MNKYDRMLRTYGINAAKNIQSSTVYIMGLKKGYAGEICKNLALTGINTIYLIGNEIIDSNDSKYWCYNNSIDEKCTNVLQKYIKELNSMVNVIILFDEHEPAWSSRDVEVASPKPPPEETFRPQRFQQELLVLCRRAVKETREASAVDENAEE